MNCNIHGIAFSLPITIYIIICYAINIHINKSIFQTWIWISESCSFKSICKTSISNRMWSYLLLFLGLWSIRLLKRPLDITAQIFIYSAPIPYWEPISNRSVFVLGWFLMASGLSVHLPWFQWATVLPLPFSDPPFDSCSSSMWWVWFSSWYAFSEHSVYDKAIRCTPIHYIHLFCIPYSIPRSIQGTTSSLQQACLFLDLQAVVSHLCLSVHFHRKIGISRSASYRVEGNCKYRYDLLYRHYFKGRIFCLFLWLVSRWEREEFDGYISVL